MKIAVLSDIHDNTPALRSALGMAQGCSELFFCGDFNSPFVVKELASGFRMPVHVVFGNNDGDRFRITNAAREFPNVVLHGEFAELQIGGRTFALNHFDNIGRSLARGGQFDVVCFGHNHHAEISSNGATLLLNPGEIYGRLTGRSTFAIYDTDSHHAELLDVAER